MSNNVELIIYLEPCSQFGQAVGDFLREAEVHFGPTTANKYGCHITITGFFNVKDSNEQNEIQHLLDEQLQNFKSATPQINMQSLLVRDDNGLPKHLLLPVTAPQEYHTAMSNLAEKCKDIVQLRIKKINHISLAYWNEPEADNAQETKWKEEVRNGAFDKIQQAANVYFQDLPDPCPWDVVLYKRVSKGNLVGQRHVFEELGRWHTSDSV